MHYEDDNSMKRQSGTGQLPVRLTQFFLEIVLGGSAAASAISGQ
jgi:hypothetical protein